MFLFVVLHASLLWRARVSLLFWRLFISLLSCPIYKLSVVPDLFVFLLSCPIYKLWIYIIRPNWIFFRKKNNYSEIEINIEIEMLQQIVIIYHLGVNLFMLNSNMQLWPSSACQLLPAWVHDFFFLNKVLLLFLPLNLNILHINNDH